MKKITAILPVLALLLSASVASAHVTVKPGQAGIGSFQTFTVSVPTEKDVPTIGLRLVLPEGLEHVSPTVKPGWTISTNSAGTTEGDEHEEELVTEIVWTGGTIPHAYRDEFTFSAKVPGTEISLLWKAYQTYRDGTVVAWALAPNEAQPKNADGSNDHSRFGPGSVTKVVDDLKMAKEADEMMKAEKMKAQAATGNATIISVIAVLISVAALYFSLRKPKI
jgi:uncharacterized protein YcnI